jgi:DNA-3-methyladenine glycosylase
MMQNRRKSELRDLLTGPGKFAQAFGLDKSYNYRKLDSNEIRICEFNDYSNSEIITTTRIGINKGAELPLRFYVKNCDFISNKVR